MANLADVLRQFGSSYLDQHTLSVAQAKAWRAIVACRTSALGGQRLTCDCCGHSHWQYNSCRNRQPAMISCAATLALHAGEDVKLESYTPEVRFEGSSFRHKIWLESN